jgi:dihydropteroate synthase
VQRGADVVRVHDVAATRDALAVLTEVDRSDTTSGRELAHQVR